MNTREMAAEYRLGHWAGIMRERKESGLSIKAYCEECGFHPNIYYYWQRKLREAACREMLPGKHESEGTSMVPAGWSVCESAPDAPGTANAVSIEIGKCRVTATAATDPELLVKVCRALASIC